MPAAQFDTMMQLQKHAIVTEAVQPAFVVVFLKSLSDLDEIVCLWMP